MMVRAMFPRQYFFIRRLSKDAALFLTDDLDGSVWGAFAGRAGYESQTLAGIASSVLLWRVVVHNERLPPEVEYL